MDAQQLNEKVGQLEGYLEKLTKDLGSVQSKLEESVRAADDIDRQRKASQSLLANFQRSLRP